MLKRRGARWARFGLFHCGNQVFNALGSNAPVIIFGASLSKAGAAAVAWLAPKMLSGALLPRGLKT